jgi:hypothetical protein
MRQGCSISDDNEKQSYSMACAKQWCYSDCSSIFLPQVSWVLFCNNISESLFQRKKVLHRPYVGKLFFHCLFCIINIAVELASSWDVWRWPPTSRSGTTTEVTGGISNPQSIPPIVLSLCPALNPPSLREVNTSIVISVLVWRRGSCFFGTLNCIGINLIAMLTWA